MKDQIQLASKLYECHDTAKKFFADDYIGKVKTYIDLIKRVQSANKIDTLIAVLKIGKTETFQENGMAMMLLMAAAVDIIEHGA